LKYVDGKRSGLIYYFSSAACPINFVDIRFIIKATSRKTLGRREEYLKNYSVIEETVEEKKKKKK